jgi:hypothetical protein
MILLRPPAIALPAAGALIQRAGGLGSPSSLGPRPTLPNRIQAAIICRGVVSNTPNRAR